MNKIFLPIESFANWFSELVLPITADAHFKSAMSFFIYDVIKIFILLFFITFLMSVINYFFPIEKVKEYLTKKKLYGLDYVLASLFGTVTPFCSCSSVPLFIGFVKGGIPLGVTLAFLISSPLVDGVVVSMLLAIFGTKVTVIYVLTGVAMSVIAGYVLGKMKLEKYLADWVIAFQVEKETESKLEKIDTTDSKMIKSKNLLKEIFTESFIIFKKVAPYVIIGIGLASFVHGYVPVGFFEQYVGIDSIWSVPLATLIGVPLYAGAAGVVPIALVFVSKGIPLGTVLAFMMSTVGLSIPEGLMLKKVMKWQLLTIFFTVTTIAIILSGYFFNLVL